MNRCTLLLRLSYWSAAIADFCVAILVWLPERMGLSEIVYPMGLVSAVTFSWGVMLLIADRKPLKRRWALIPTIVVVGLLSLVRAIFAWIGAIEFSLALMIFGITLIALMAYSYYCASRPESAT